jgi:ADP-L-glycero-D-manno-heptose 6-epimerase
MIIVTGGAGFIGSQLARRLAAQRDDVLVVDNLTNGHKFRNLVGMNILSFLDKGRFLDEIDQHLTSKVEAIFHLGACSKTTEWDGRYMMENNYQYSLALLERALKHRIPLIYASSAAVYGGKTTADGKTSAVPGGPAAFREELAHEAPLNVYGYSKWMFDQAVRRVLPAARSQIVGLRFFNVFGPGEAHKGGMASVALHAYQQLHQDGRIRLFEGSGGYGNGEQRRDFVYVDDVVSVLLWFFKDRQASGIFNCGSGQSRSFNDLAQAILTWHGGRGGIDYIPMPEGLKDSYQHFTEADLSRLRAAGCGHTFRPLEEGVNAYLDALGAQARLGR